MPKPTKITPNLDYPNNEPADLKAENVDPQEADAIGAPTASKVSPPDASPTSTPSDPPTSIEEQENEDLEVDEGLEDGSSKNPRNVPRF